jgi:hypothetical protein
MAHWESLQRPNPAALYGGATFADNPATSRRTIQLKKQKRVLSAVQDCCARRIAQAAAVVLCTCSALAHANDCAGGTDVTGNDCSGGPVALSEADTRMLYLKGAVTAGELAVIRARDQQSAANDRRKAADANLKSARKALNDAEREGRR